jgi:hypothetical protein
MLEDTEGRHEVRHTGLKAGPPEYEANVSHSIATFGFGVTAPCIVMGGNILSPISGYNSALKIEAVCCCKTLVTTFLTTQ